jgi:hypothetical protein
MAAAMRPANRKDLTLLKVLMERNGPDRHNPDG